jgi:Polyketide cyclase / dehydrase and lipid transport
LTPDLPTNVVVGALVLAVLVFFNRIHVTRTHGYSIIVRSSVGDSFDFVASPTNTAAWNPWIKTVTVTTDGPVGVGTKYQLHVRRAGQELIQKCEIVEYQPPSRFAIETQGRAVRGLASLKVPLMTSRSEYIFEATDAGTRITYTTKARILLLASLWGTVEGARIDKRMAALMKAALDGAATGDDPN